MAFWTTVNDGAADPKRNFRWKIDIGYMTGEGDTSQTSNGVVWWAKKVTKPNFTIQESKHNFLNHTFYWPGRVEWQIISLTLVDPADPNTVQMTNKLIRDAGYVVPGNTLEASLETMSKAKAKFSLSHVKIQQINHEGTTIEEWTLQNPFIKSVKYGELDYENDDLTQIELEFRYDWATCAIDQSTDVDFPTT